jgi:hypothetical protein
LNNTIEIKSRLFIKLTLQIKVVEIRSRCSVFLSPFLLCRLNHVLADSVPSHLSEEIPALVGAAAVVHLVAVPQVPLAMYQNFFVVLSVLRSL